ncbi:MAG: hypothetical protein IPM57_02040 [Oligoflexia bacterium]|nr:hypothetical protein [Oligoflexia bacterium]
MLSSIFNSSFSHACATCGFNDASNNYYLILIIVMTSIPIALVGGMVLYLKKQRDKNVSHEK